MIGRTTEIKPAKPTGRASLCLTTAVYNIGKLSINGIWTAKKGGGKEMKVQNNKYINMEKLAKQFRKNGLRCEIIIKEIKKG